MIVFLVKLVVRLKIVITFLKKMENVVGMEVAIFARLKNVISMHL